MSDYLILGGGLVGCVLATRLKEYLPDATVTLVEAGPDEQIDPLLVEPLNTPQLTNSKYQYNYTTAPQKHLNGRETYFAGGKVLSGSSSVNYAAWTRGDRADYDLWAEEVGDSRWSYDSQLPYFRKTETHFDAAASVEVHGFDGPIHTTPASTRSYTLAEPVKEAFRSVGIEPIDDHNCGNNRGLAVHVESWRDGKRQPAAKAYGLAGVDVVANSPVRRIIIDIQTDGTKRAVGAELVSGRIIKAKKEVILSCGAIKSPHVLLLSGIGPQSELGRNGIEMVLNAPHVGRNFHEHLAITQFFKVKEPEKGLCAPSPNFKGDRYTEGFPGDYIIGASAPVEIIEEALRKDGELVEGHPLVSKQRTNYELLPLYAPIEIPRTDLNIPLDGSVISVGVINVLPTSRGSITLRSADPEDEPIIDPNYYATNTDRAVLRAALRRTLAAFEGKDGQAIVEGEVPPPLYPVINSQSTDEELDNRARRASSTFYHGGGSVAMGKAVDSECRLYGVAGLRVIDASVFPKPLSAHYQVPCYALAEQMAQVIANT